MRIPRIFLDQALERGIRVVLPEEQARHISTVLRMQEGARLRLFNGRGGDFDATIVGIRKKLVEVEIGEFDEVSRESDLQLHLGQAISRGERMDFSIQKAVELGASTITPINSGRSVVNLDEKRAVKRMLHWRGVIESACEQSGRNHIPTLNEPQTLEQWLLAQTSVALRLIFLPGEHPGLNVFSPYLQRDIAVMVGPEGGFDERETAQALNAGFTPVSFGPRILRSETATVAVLTAVQLLWGDLAKP